MTSNQRKAAMTLSLEGEVKTLKYMTESSDKMGRTKAGIALLYNKETNNTYDVRLKLTKEVFTIQKLDVVCTRGGDTQLNHRTVVLRRQAAGGLGLSIK
ncbi:unnamed protein product, partial [Coregonus sp. 'balchen']